MIRSHVALCMLAVRGALQEAGSRKPRLPILHLKKGTFGSSPYAVTRPHVKGNPCFLAGSPSDFENEARMKSNRGAPRPVRDCRKCSTHGENVADDCRITTAKATRPQHPNTVSSAVFPAASLEHFLASFSPFPFAHAYGVIHWF